MPTENQIRSAPERFDPRAVGAVVRRQVQVIAEEIASPPTLDDVANAVEQLAQPA
jgi:hypothetical protein